MISITNNNNKKPTKKKKQLLSRSKNKSKSKHHRTNTFNSSQFSALQDKLQKNFVSSSVCDLFRHNSIKIPKFQNASLVVSTGRPLKKKIHQKSGQSVALSYNQNQKKKPKKIKTKSKPKIQQKIQPYQYVYLHPSHSNSQIVFSNEDTKRESQNMSQFHFDKKPHNPMNLQQQYLIKKPGQKLKQNLSTQNNALKKNQFKKKSSSQKQNKLNKSKRVIYNENQQISNEDLRISIKRKYWIQYEAAIKIQKVFRGYLTRKILSKYISHQQDNLNRKKKQIISKKSQRQFNYGNQLQQLISFDRNSDSSFQDQYFQSYLKQQDKSSSLKRKQRQNIFNLTKRQITFDNFNNNKIDLNKSNNNNSINNSNKKKSSKNSSHNNTYNNNEMSLNTFQDDSHQQFQISQFDNTINNKNLIINNQIQKQQSSEEQDSQYLNQNNNMKRRHYQSYPHQHYNLYKNYSQRGQDEIQNQQEHQQEEEEKQQQQEEEYQQYQQQDSQNDQPISLAYRHQQPIYSHQQISDFLQQNQNSDEENYQQEEQDEYQPNIIFQTNQQYIQSRKSSLQNKNSTKNQLVAAKNSYSQNSKNSQGNRFNTEKNNQNDNQNKQFQVQGFNQSLENQQPFQRGSFQLEKSLKKNKKKQDKNQQNNSNDNLQIDRKYSLEHKKSNERPFISKNSPNNNFQTVIKINDLSKASSNQHRLEEQKKKLYEQPITTNPTQLTQKINTQNSDNCFPNYNLTFKSQQDAKMMTQTYSFPAEEKKINKLVSQSHQRSRNQKQTKANNKIVKNDKNKRFQVIPRNQNSPNKQFFKKVFSKQIKQDINSCSSSSINNKNSSVSQQQKSVRKLKQSEKKRWQQISKMIVNQVKQNQLKNTQLSSFMNSILQMCQKNKQSLDLTQEGIDEDEIQQFNMNNYNDYQNYQTPTTTIDIFRTTETDSYSNINISSQISQNQFQTIQYTENQNRNEDQSNSKFRKKKNLKIQIVNNNISNQDRLSLSKSKDLKDKGFKKDISLHSSAQKKENQNIKLQSNSNNVNSMNISFHNQAPIVIIPKPHHNLSQRRKSKQQLQELAKLRDSQLDIQQSEQSQSFINSSQISSNDLKSNNQKRRQLKNFLVQNIQNDSLNQMLKLRQQLLLKRQSQMLVKLNNQLSDGKLSQSGFIKKLQKLTLKFQQEKSSIDKAREDIEKGYQAAMGLVKQAYKDARKLGAKINFCKSMGNMKIKQIKLIQNIIVDQFQCFTPKNNCSFSNKKKLFQQKSKSNKIQIKTQKQRQKLKQKQKQIQSNNQSNFIFNHPNLDKQFQDDFSSASSVQFTQQQLQRFRKIKPYDSQFVQMNKNITISDDFLKQHLVQNKIKHQLSKEKEENLNQIQKSSEKELSQKSFESSEKIKLTSEAYRQIYQVDIDDNQSSNNQNKFPQIDPIKDQIAQLIFKKILYQCSIQILQRPILSQKILDRSYLSRPRKISKFEQQLFIQILQQNFPNDEILLSKLNQKISPLPSQLLKCMRIQFNQPSDVDVDQTMNASNQNESDDNDYQQIGKYEFIIGQDVCAQTLQKFRKRIQSNNLQKIINKPIIRQNNKRQYQKRILGIQKQKSIEQRNQNSETQSQEYCNFQHLNEKFNFDDRAAKYLSQRQKFIQNKLKHTKGLRWQILNIQVHAIFDAWNQQLIQIRSKKSGYSGIGLNQLTISTLDQNKPILLQQVRPMIEQGKQKVLSILNDDSQLNQKMLKQNFEEMCYSDSTWIFYADEALSYGLQLGYLIQEQIFTQCAREIIKQILGVNFSCFGNSDNSSQNEQSQAFYESQQNIMKYNNSQSFQQYSSNDIKQIIKKYEEQQQQLDQSQHNL